MGNSQKQSDREMQREAKGYRERPCSTERKRETQTQIKTLTETHTSDRGRNRERCREALRYVERAPQHPLQYIRLPAASVAKAFCSIPGPYAEQGVFSKRKRNSLT